jgi:hypothetical protein
MLGSSSWMPSALQGVKGIDDDDDDDDDVFMIIITTPNTADD